jgi:hypothetical protein
MPGVFASSSDVWSAIVAFPLALLGIIAEGRQIATTADALRAGSQFRLFGAAEDIAK